ncbi:MAG: hypothetical protein V1681_04980 [Candidatus Neomarinimicrobiota bacterium]
MINIPEVVRIKASIQTGSVYYFPDEHLTSKDPHYFIVININPLTDSILLLLCVSSQIEKVKNRCRNNPETSVMIFKNEYEPLQKDSIVNCNDIFQISIDQLIAKLQSGQLKIKPEMDQKIIEKFHLAIFQSLQVSLEIKKILGYE